MRKIRVVLSIALIIGALISCSESKSKEDVPNIKWGVSESKRFEIRYDLDIERQKSHDEADLKHPIKPGVTRKEIEANYDYGMEYMKERKVEMAKKHNLPVAIIDSIEWELTLKEWNKRME